MLEKVGQKAEQVATRVSRRAFLGLFRGAALTAAIGGMLAVPAIAHAGRRPWLCGPGSISSCLGFMEGTSCSAARAFGKCVGPKGGRWTETTTCGCSADAPR